MKRKTDKDICDRLASCTKEAGHRGRCIGQTLSSGTLSKKTKHSITSLSKTEHQKLKKKLTKANINPSKMKMARTQLFDICSKSASCPRPNGHRGLCFGQKKNTTKTDKDKKNVAAGSHKKKSKAISAFPSKNMAKSDIPKTSDKLENTKLEFIFKSAHAHIIHRDKENTNGYYCLLHNTISESRKKFGCIQHLDLTKTGKVQLIQLLLLLYHDSNNRYVYHR